MEKIRKGYYLRYDGKLVFVVALIENADTGERLVLCKRNTNREQKYFVVGKDAFLSPVEVGGESVPRYCRCCKSRAVSEAEAQALYKKGGEYPPEEWIRGKTSRAAAQTEAAFAKAICESFLHDLRLVRQGMSGTDRGEYEAAKKNVLFLQRCLSGALKEYAAYFQERFVEGVSIRGYAKSHGINRGSAAYVQKKFFAALARCISEESEKVG